MNALELLGLKELEKHLWSAKARCKNENEGRMEHERVFIDGDLRRALEVLQALQENNKP